MMPSSSDAAALAERRVPPRTTPATPAGPALLANHRKAAAGTSGRIFLALRGDISRVGTDGKPLVVGSLGEKEDLTAAIRKDDWNAAHLIVWGNTMIHLINGRVMSLVVDDDLEKRRFEGLLGVQVHVGPPMKVTYRKLRLKVLPASGSEKD